MKKERSKSVQISASDPRHIIFKYAIKDEMYDMTISKDIRDKMEKYAPRLGKTIEELEIEYKDYYELATQKYTQLSGKKLANKALDLLVNSYRRKHGDVRYSSAEMYEGWIDGATALRDQVQEKIRRVTWIVKQDGRDAALLQELIDENGVPIDDRPNIFGRRKNENYGKPLVNAEPAYIRTIYGIGRKKGETTFGSFQMTFFEEAARQLTFKTNVPCEFRASPAKKAGSLFGSDTTKFFPITTDWDMENIYDGPNIIIPCEEVEARMTSRDWDLRDVRVKVDVININPNPLNEKGDRVMGIADISLDLTDSISCFVPAHVNMNFGQDSKIMVVGRARAYKNNPSINVYGIWPIPGEITYTDVDLDEEAIVDVGWVEPEMTLGEEEQI